MIIGTTIFKLDGNAYYTPAFPRGGQAATFSIDVTHLEGSPTVTVTIQGRNRDETSWTDLGTFSSITTTGVKTRDQPDLKEIVRLKFTFAAGDDSTDAMHFLVMPPSWRSYA